MDIQQSLFVIGNQAFEMFQMYLANLIVGSGATITTKTAADIASSISVGLFSPISGQIDPLRLGETERQMKIASAYGQRLNPKKSDIIEKLVSEYPSHNFVIDYEEAKKLFGCVREPKNDEYELEEALFFYARKPLSDQNIIADLLESDDKEEGECENEGEEQYLEDGSSPEEPEEANNVSVETKNGNQGNETRNDTKRKRGLEKTVRGNDEKNTTDKEESLSALDYNNWQK